MYKKIIIALSLAFAAVGFSACTMQEETKETEPVTQEQQAETRNIVQLAQGTPTLSTLVAAVVAGDLVETLSSDTVEYTVFAPSNAGFAAIQATVDTLLLPENKDDLRSVLTYHVVQGTVRSSALRDGQRITTVQGDELIVTMKNGSVYINNAMVSLPDVEAANGIVHVIDQVLVPGSKTIAELAADTPDLSTLVAAVTAADLVEVLSDPTAQFTVFAPSNAAFAAIQSTVDTLLLPENQDDLADVLLYHVVAGDVRSGALSNGQTVPTMNGGSLTVTIADGVVRINGAQVVTADVDALNGVVHLIDGVLVP